MQLLQSACRKKAFPLMLQVLSLGPLAGGKRQARSVPLKRRGFVQT